MTFRWCRHIRSSCPVAPPVALDRAAEMILAGRAAADHARCGGRVGPSSSTPLSSFVRRTRIPFFNTQMGKGSVTGGSNLYMGTAALSSGDYVHQAVDHADLIIAIGHDTVEKPPFIMGPNGPKVIHVGFTAANVEQVYFPHAEVVGDVGPSLALLADRIEGKLKIDSAFTGAARAKSWRVSETGRTKRGFRRRRSASCTMCER